MVELTFCETKPLPRPSLTHSSLPLLLQAMILDRLIVARDASRVLQSAALINHGRMTLELLESTAPSEAYRVFRWLRGFCSEGQEDSGRIALNASLPHTSAVIALSGLRGAEGSVRVRMPRRAPPSLVVAVDRVISHYGLLMEIERCDEPLAPQTWSAPPAIDMIAHALGDAAALGRDVLAEVLESGGAIVGKALLGLLDRGQHFVLKLLVAFDFLRPHTTGSGLVFALTQKAFEALI